MMKMKGENMKTSNHHQRISFWGRIGRAIKRPQVMFAALFAMFAVALLPLGSANAWGPQRNTFTMQNPSTYVTFDSITDNPDWGDERGFTLIKDLGTSPANNGTTASGGGFVETVPAVAGHTYMVKMFVHNNASANLNLVAKNTRVLADMVTASTDGDIMIQGKIKADNCGANTTGATGSPCLFWDEAYLDGTSGTYLKASYVANSARYYNNVKDFTTTGFTLTNDIASSTGSGAAGALLGYNSMDGNIQGCFEYSGYVTFLITVQADKPEFTLSKQVRLKGTTEWKDAITAQPGAQVEYQIKYNNIGTSTQNDVIIKDLLPTGSTYTTKSAYLYNSSNQNGIVQPDDTWLTKGWGVGNYAPNTGSSSSAIIELAATMPGNDQLFCGDNLLQNFAIAYTEDAGNQMDNADVTIHKDCATPCPTNPDLAIDDEKCKPCPTNPNLNIDDPGCKPCPTNPDILANDPKCKPCKWNDKISADDAKCVGPSDAGFSLPPSATISLVLFLGLMGILLGGMFLRKKKSTRR
jgi:uncharacterized repeat protein (TIGR01451 family)